ncbi:OLC1v1029789C1 [Oldenlandia corymbosa var. corymbosa]|uniref:OLC1v1029789C1 n=1 Tax=Oldenlandia corymbosa var. corymbosa TaxID=529605 RepID=A0AAV1CF92_OLDCO|nr:OLC1v1029789C1 [Oldenlandia corymbosa var. corymbosa]
MLRTELCSARILSPFRDESGDDELTVLPRHTKVVVTGNNRTKSVLVGLQGVVKKAVGLGGWHWLVLKNGVEVKLQRNALSVLEPPTGNEEDDEYVFSDSTSGSDMGEKDTPHFSAGMQFSKFGKPRVRYARPWVHSASTKSVNRSSSREILSDNHATQQQPRMIMTNLGTGSLWRYFQSYKLASINPNPPKEQLVKIVQQHFSSQRVDEVQVVVDFVRAAKRLRTVDAH